jgi:hypothetical protein
MRIFGIILIVIGILVLAVPYISFTTKERAVDIGPIKIDKEEEHTVPLSPIAGGAAVLVGAGLVIATIVRKN